MFFAKILTINFRKSYQGYVLLLHSQKFENKMFKYCLTGNIFPTHLALVS